MGRQTRSRRIEKISEGKSKLQNFQNVCERGLTSQQDCYRHRDAATVYLWLIVGFVLEEAENKQVSDEATHPSNVAPGGMISVFFLTIDGMTCLRFCCLDYWLC